MVNNILTVILISILLVNLPLELISLYFSKTQLNKKLPDLISDVFDKEEYTKFQRYSYTNLRFSLIQTIFSFVIFILAWQLKIFNMVDLFVTNLGFNSIVSGILFFALLTIGSSVISLPFSIYHTFVIEEKFGFNKTTLKTFILDILKSVLLGALIGLPILYLVLYVLELHIANMWLYLWGILIAITGVMYVIVPNFIMPLFNKFTPLEDGELKERINQLSVKLDFPISQLYVVDGSRRSAKANAYFTGLGRYKKIALYDTLISNLSNEEILSVLAHEIGHYKKKHIFKGLFISFVQQGLMLFILGQFLENNSIVSVFYFEKASVYTSLFIFSFFYTPIELLLSIFNNYVSRKNEYEADFYSVVNTNSQSNMITSLKKLTKLNMSNLNPHPFNVFLHYSHPSLAQRIGAIKGIAK